MTSGTEIYVGNIPFQMEDDELRDCFKEFGVISKAFVMRDPETRRSKGFGYVVYEEESEAALAVERGHGMDVRGRALRVERSRPRSDRPREYRGGDRGDRNRDDRPRYRDDNRQGGGYGDRSDRGRGRGYGYGGGNRFRNDDSRGGDSRGGYREKNYGRSYDDDYNRR